MKRTAPKIDRRAAAHGAEVVNLSDRRKRQHADDANVMIVSPENSRPGDKFMALNVLAHERSIGARPGDTIVCYITNDVQKDDLAVVLDDEDEVWIGDFDFDVCNFYLDGAAYHRSKTKLVGRVIELHRGMTRRKPKIYLRPLRESALVYQFKRRPL